MELISATQALSDACTQFAAQPFVTVDTEFMRETTYYPKLCLIQMAGPDGFACLVDPLAKDLDLKPFFDTQVAAMVCGYGDSVSYEQLVNDVAKARIDKSSRFTDWSRRPLSEAQLAYALSDVTHLVTIYQVLAAELLSTDRGLWLDEEMAVLTSPETYQAEPAQAWRRLAGRMRKPREIAVLMEVAAWREAEAQSRNVPRGRILKDEAVIDIATAGPRSVEALGRLRTIPAGFERSRTATEILAAV
jgi:ribonuclease D